MKLDSNSKMINGDGNDTPEEILDPRQHAEDIIDEILADFTESRSPDLRHGIGLPDNFLNILQSPRTLAGAYSINQPPQTRTPANSFSENTSVDDIDPSSDLGTSIRNKCMELEEILQTLKSRLNHVVLDDNIMISPEANSLEAQLEHDLDTDCQEDLSLQEFLEILHSQNKISHSSVQ
ncbi:unnamed protein product [Leptidea sinapis]|uniref:Uncharacterized protein n=1 Tax=Leptidea sinapis TaxID=189913 RepID=A0A5E4PUV7_9NEOP|nr:unnamed protein product [Leptidea sinapis]